MPRTTILLLTIVLHLPHSSAQEKLITVSPRVGNEIDSSECALYGILGQFRGLRKAVVYQAPDSSYRMLLTLSNSSGQEKDTSFAVTPAFLHVLFSKIEYQDALKSGALTLNRVSSPYMGQSPPTGDLPFGTGPSLFNEYPRLGFSAGVSSFKPELVGLENAMLSILDGYRAQGYTIQSATKPASLKMPLLAPVFGLSGAFTPEWQAELLTSVPTGGDVGIWYSSLTATYTPEFLSASTVRLGFSAGIIRFTHEFSTTDDFGNSSRISPIDSLGRYVYLRSITVAGSGTQWGGSVSILGEFHRDGFSLFSAFVQYMIAPTYNSKLVLSDPPAGLPIDQSQLGQYQFRIHGFSVGAKLTIHF